MNTVMLKSDDAVRILNMVYSVFLAIIGRFAIEQVAGNDHKPLEVHFLISRSNWIPVLLLLSYFIFDWLSMNITLPMKANVAHALLPIMIVGIFVLGGLVAFAFAPSHAWILIFGLYAAATPWYDIIATKPDDEDRQGLRNCIIIYAIMLGRVATGLFIFCIGCFKMWIYPDGRLQAADGWLLAWVAVYVGLKLTRYLVFLPIHQTKKQP